MYLVAFKTYSFSSEENGSMKHIESIPDISKASKIFLWVKLALDQ